jgi:repressor LexA
MANPQRPPSRAPLTRRQRQILDFYRAYSASHGMSPTLEEVAQHFGVNKVTIFGHVAELQRKGILARPQKRVSRGMQLVDDPAPSSPTSVSILGRIAAGSPIQAIEDPEELQLADLVPKDRNVFALRVRGDSMIEDGIHDGDIVLVEGRKEARNGEMVVAILEDEEATLKRLYREGDGYRLQPANSSMAPLHVRDLEVRGVVIGVVRRY